MATSYKDQLMERAPHLDMVVGPDQYLKVPQVIREASGRAKARCWRISTRFISRRTIPSRLSQPHRAFIEIMKGCDKFCTFCVVPFTRGREVSRPTESILEEITGDCEGGREGSHAAGPEREFLWIGVEVEGPRRSPSRSYWDKWAEWKGSSGCVL